MVRGRGARKGVALVPNSREAEMLSPSNDTIRLPLSHEQPPPAPRPSPADRSASNERPGVRVLLVENHPPARRALRDLLGADPWLVPVGAARDPILALGEAARLHPDVVVIDDCVGLRDALVLTLQLKALDPSAEVLVLSTYDDALLAVASVVAGADGLMSKAILAEDLRPAVHELGRGRSKPSTITPHAFDVAAFRVDPDDVPLLSLLCHATPLTEICRLAGITPARLEARRWAMLARLTAAPPLFSLSGSARATDGA